jgi:hypothetical protein
MTELKPTTPEAHAGIFHCHADIPARYRLETYASYYEREDTLDRYLNQVYFKKKPEVSDSIQRRAHRFRDSWIDHMEDRDRHHALATSEDVNTWCQILLERCTARTSYKTYYCQIYNFYEYLKTSYRHPHLYNPLLLAAIEHEPTYEIWTHRVKERPSNNL